MLLFVLFVFCLFVCLFWVNLCFNGLPLNVFVLLCVCMHACVHACFKSNTSIFRIVCYDLCN